jgi:IrrE N-terminal-like domain
MSFKPYQHPGYAFLHQYGSLQTEADIYDYVNFLRQSAGLDDRIPVDLDRIFTHFGIPIPLRVPLEDQQGILLDSDRGVILIREGDPIERQRFTEGHELMELLFDAQNKVTQELNLTPWDEDRKEKLCDAGAAELLMPQATFQSHLDHLGTSLESGRSLCRLYKTSLIATLIRMVQLTGGEHALIAWQFLNNAEGERLRTEWCVVSPGWQQGFIPKSHFISADVLRPNLIAHSQGINPLKKPTLRQNTRRQNARSTSSRIYLEIDDWSLSCRAEILDLTGKSSPGIISFLHL